MKRLNQRAKHRGLWITAILIRDSWQRSATSFSNSANCNVRTRTDGRREDGDGANLITTSSKQITRERGERRRERERVTVEVKRDKIDRRHDVAVANAFIVADDTEQS